MKIIAVVGTGSGCGKTTVACAILRAFPGLGAVKISPRDGESFVEWGPGEPGKDTDLFVRSGAVRVARIIGPRDQVCRTWESIKDQFIHYPGVVIEGASALGIPGERYVVFVAGEMEDDEREERNRAMAANADLIFDRSSHLNADFPIDQIRNFLS